MGSIKHAVGAQGSSRYDILHPIASGGMATVYVGCVRGPFELASLVAIKRLHTHLHADAAMRSALIAEAQVAARIRHTNVVDVRDIEIVDGSLQLVMSYIEGTTLSGLLTAGARSGRHLPASVAIRIALDSLAGLHAAHELCDDHVNRLELIHRDVSPQNLLIGIDGITRVTDFGVAKTQALHQHRTATGMLKGKFSYMAPEYIYGQSIDRRLDIFALGVVLWESLAHRRLFKGANQGETFQKILNLVPPKLHDLVPGINEEISAVVAKAIERAPQDRFETAEAFATALEAAAQASGLIASYAEVSKFLRHEVGPEIEKTREVLRELRRSSSTYKNEPNDDRLTKAEPAVIRRRGSDPAIDIEPVGVDRTTPTVNEGKAPNPRVDREPAESSESTITAQAGIPGQSPGDTPPIGQGDGGPEPLPYVCKPETMSANDPVSVFFPYPQAGVPVAPVSSKLPSNVLPSWPPWPSLPLEEPLEVRDHVVSSGDRATPLLVRPIKDVKQQPQSQPKQHYGPTGTAVMLGSVGVSPRPASIETQPSPGVRRMGSAPDFDRSDMEEASQRRSSGMMRAAMGSAPHRFGSRPDLNQERVTPGPAPNGVSWVWLVVAALFGGMLIGAILWQAGQSVAAPDTRVPGEATPYRRPRPSDPAHTGE